MELAENSAGEVVIIWYNNDLGTPGGPNTVGVVSGTVEYICVDFERPSIENSILRRDRDIGNSRQTIALQGKEDLCEEYLREDADAVTVLLLSLQYGLIYSDPNGSVVNGKPKYNVVDGKRLIKIGTLFMFIDVFFESFRGYLHTAMERMSRDVFGIPESRGFLPPWQSAARFNPLMSTTLQISRMYHLESVFWKHSQVMYQCKYSLQ
jgi:hypothetical protein